MSKHRKFCTRCKISHRPSFRVEQPKFFRCVHCNNLIIQTTLIIKNGTNNCCNHYLEKIHINNEGNILDEIHKIKYIIFGGFEQNAIKVSIGQNPHPMTQEHCIEWIYLYTFQGGQIKYLTKNKPPEAIFVLADEDAFVYCDRTVCKMGHDQCEFQCKRGFVIYAYCNIHGLKMFQL